MQQKKEASDNELVASYLKGDERSLQVLIIRHKSRIFTSIYLLVKEKELANDLFQDTFIKVINTLRSGHYKEEGKFLPWVVRIAHNLVIDYFRREQRMPMVRDTEEYSVINNIRLVDENVEDRMVTEQIYHEVRMLIEELPEEQREVVMMRHYANLSFKEIADIMDCSINTALGRMRYAILNMRKIMEKKKLVLER
ncbi:MAG: sigma-70 family RNA polymerase sigma factor [Bacteroidia bacterium]